MSMPPTLYLANESNLWNHIVHFCMLEKSMDFRRVECDAKKMPHGITSTPVLEERSIQIDEPLVMLQFIEERFPEPNLMASDPVSRARVRQLMLTLERELLVPIQQLASLRDNPNTILRRGDEIISEEDLREEMTQHLADVAGLFESQDHVLHNDFGMLDIMFAPALYRARSIGIPIATSKGIQDYMKRVFERPAFVESLNHGNVR